jgi:hypothetical protein
MEPRHNRSRGSRTKQEPTARRKGARAARTARKRARAKSRPSPKKPPARARYSARAWEPGSPIVEIATGNDLERLIAAAEAHHAQHPGRKIWIWCLRTGATLHRCQAGTKGATTS